MSLSVISVFAVLQKYLYTQNWIANPKVFCHILKGPSTMVASVGFVQTLGTFAWVKACPNISTFGEGESNVDFEFAIKQDQIP